MPDERTLLSALEKVGDRTLLASDSREVSGTQLLSRSESLAEHMRSTGTPRFVSVIHSADELLISMAIAERLCGVVLLLPSWAATRLQEMEDTWKPHAVLQNGELRSIKGGVRRAHGEAEFHLLTSGTSGDPKIVRHTFSTLSARVRPLDPDVRRTWLLTYSPASFAGIQVVLTAVIAGDLVVTAKPPSPAPSLRLAAERKVTGISSTPTFLRGFLAAGADQRHLPRLQQLTLGGEIADQHLLDAARCRFPETRVIHIYATSEAGALFSVKDGKEGFPAQWLESGVGNIQVRILDGTLRVLNAQKMIGYWDGPTVPDWIDTGDLVEVRDDRVLFLGRADRRINVAGYKINPEQVEHALCLVSGVQDSRVHAVHSRLTGAVLAADVVPDSDADLDALRGRIFAFLRQNLAAHQVPRLLEFVPEIAMTGAGKKLRNEESLPLQVNA